MVGFHLSLTSERWISNEAIFLQHGWPSSITDIRTMNGLSSQISIYLLLSNKVQLWTTFNLASRTFNVSLNVFYVCLLNDFSIIVFFLLDSVVASTLEISPFGVYTMKSAYLHLLQWISVLSFYGKMISDWSMKKPAWLFLQQVGTHTLKDLFSWTTDSFYI